MHAMKELNVARDDIQAIGKISPLVTPLGGKVFWVSREFRVQLQKIKKAYGSWGGEGRRGDPQGGLKPGLQPCVLFRGQTSPQVALVQ